MSDGDRPPPPLRLLDGGRASRPSSAPSKTDRLAALIAKGVAASGHGEELADELARSYLDAVGEAPKSRPDPFDPLVRHVGHTDGFDGERGGPVRHVGHADGFDGERGGPASPAVGVLAGVLGSVPEPGALPSLAPSPSRPVTSAVDSPQAHYRRRGGAKRKRRDDRRHRRKEHDKERLAKLREDIFAQYGQTADIPEIPSLRPEIYGMNLSVMRDGTGRRAREVLAKLPLTQQMAVYELAHAAAPKVRSGQACSFSRADLASAPSLPEGRAELLAALEVIRDEVAPSLWFRRVVCAAWGMWSHRGRALSELARKAARGGVFMIEGFCQNALSWLVPRPDGTPWSRSVLWGPNGPFALLSASSRQLGRKVSGQAGAGLWTRWQAAVGAARFKGPTRKNSRTGKTERFALAQTRYDAAMCGRTASGLARRGRGALRELARTVVSVMTPWVELPERKRKASGRSEVAEEPVRGFGSAPARDARAPP